MSKLIITKDKINALKSDDGMKIYQNKNNEEHYILRYNKQKVDDISKYSFSSYDLNSYQKKVDVSFYEQSLLIKKSKKYHQRAPPKN